MISSISIAKTLLCYENGRSFSISFHATKNFFNTGFFISAYYVITSLT